VTYFREGPRFVIGGQNCQKYRDILYGWTLGKVKFSGAMSPEITLLNVVAPFDESELVIISWFLQDTFINTEFCWLAAQNAKSTA